MGGGRLTERLKQLEQTSFIYSSIPWHKERGEYYRIIDEFCLFYLTWFKNRKEQLVPLYWIKQIQKPSYHAWAGYAFEAVCYKHINKIISALNIDAAESIGSWRHVTRDKNKSGAQIDLLIDRSNKAISVCEIKYSDKPFVITKQYAENLKNKISLFRENTNTKKHIFLIMISANSVKQNLHSKELLDAIVSADAFFND